MVRFILVLFTLIKLSTSFKTIPSTTIKVSSLLLLHTFNHPYSSSVYSSKIGGRSSSQQQLSTAVVMEEKDSCNTMMISMENRKKAALYGLYVSDATAMPVHWFYDVSRLRSEYGQIKGYVKPKDTFPGSILNLSNTGGGRHLYYIYMM